MKKAKIPLIENITDKSVRQNKQAKTMKPVPLIENINENSFTNKKSANSNVKRRIPYVEDI